MINVTIHTTDFRGTDAFAPNTTIRQILEAKGINYSNGQTMLDGSALTAGQMDKTLADLGITDHCMLNNVAKHDNA